MQIIAWFLQAFEQETMKMQTNIRRKKKKIKYADFVENKTTQ